MSERVALTALVRAAQTGRDLTAAVRAALPALPAPSLIPLLLSLEQQGFVDLHVEYYPGSRRGPQDVYRAYVTAVHSTAAAMIRDTVPDGSEIEKRRARRVSLLKELYAAGGGRIDAWVPRARFARHVDAETNFEVLRESGLVEIRDGAIRLTARGFSDAEAAFDAPVSPAPPPMHIEHHVTVSGTNVQYASPGATQTNITVIDPRAVEAVRRLVAEMQRLAGAASDDGHKQFLDANRQRLEFELAASEPSSPVVAAVLTSLKTATEGMLSSAMYDGLRAALRLARRAFGL